MDKLTKKERLYDVTQLAKAIFIENASRCSFQCLPQEQIDQMIENSFKGAEEFIKHQEQYAEKVHKNGLQSINTAETA